MPVLQCILNYSTSLRDFITCIIACLSIISARPALALSSEPVFEHLSIEQGLSDSVVKTIAQDKQGFLWIGTENGLNRYDGYNFTRYRHRLDDEYSLISNEITAIYEDRFGDIWIGTENGLQLYQRGLNRFIYPYGRNSVPGDENSSNESSQPGTSMETDRSESITADEIRFDDQEILQIYEDQAGNLHVLSYEGLFLYDRKNRRFVNVQKQPGYLAALQNEYIETVYLNKAGYQWFSTNRALYGFDGKLLTTYPYESDLLESLDGEVIKMITEDYLGDLWLGTEEFGLFRFMRKAEKIVRYEHRQNQTHGLCDSEVNVIFEDADTNIWVGTLNGLSKFDRGLEDFDCYQNEPHDPNSLSYNEIGAIFEDSSGVLWVGTDGGGLNKFNHRTEHFLHYQHQPDNPSSLSHNRVQTLYEDSSGILWIGTEDGGLNRMDRTTETFSHIQNDEDDPHSLSSNEITSLLEDQAGNFWVGTDEGGLNLFDRSSGKFRHYFHDYENPNSLSNDVLVSMIEDHAGMLWIGTEGGGLNRFDRNAELFTHFKPDKDNPMALLGDEVWAIHEDHRREIWVGTNEGLNRYDRGTETFSNFQSDHRFSKQLGHRIIHAIHEDQAGVLWIGTSNGLIRLDRERENIKPYSEQDGLPYVSVYGILEDEQRLLWLSTGNGLSKFDPKTETFINYDNNDLRNTTFFPGAYFKSRSGEMFFGGMHGFNAFHPDKIKDNLHPPNIVITELKISNQPVSAGEKINGRIILKQTITETQELELTHNDEVISFEFAALDFTIPENNRYAYMMEGFDTDWNQVGTRRLATYTNLPHGEYQFRIKGSNNDRKWNEAGVSLKLRVIPPPWKTWWAYTLYLLGLAGMVMAYVHYRTKAQHQILLRKEKELAQEKLLVQQERLVADRLRQVDQLEKDKKVAEAAARTKGQFLANMSHEIRTPMNSILGFLELSLEDQQLSDQLRKQLTIVFHSAQFLLSLLNDILDVSKIESGKLELEERPFDLVELINETIGILDVEASKKGLSLISSLPPELHTAYLGDPLRLRQILLNLIGNAIKFTEKGWVMISVKSANEPNKLTFSVVDSGIGIPADSISKILEPFTQLDASTTRRFGGTGLGTTISKQLIELMDGDIRIESELNKGTTFCFTINLPETHEQVPTLFGSEARMPDTWRVFKVLVADDIDENIALAKIRLEERGHTVLTANNGAEAIKIFKSEHPDIVLMDVQMPEMDGLEATRQIRMTESANHSANTQPTPVIAMTASIMDEDRVRCREAGMNEIIAKPVDFSILFSVIERFVPQGRGETVTRVTSEMAHGPSSEMPQLDGIDVDNALSTWQNPDAYSEALTHYASTYRNQVDQINLSLNSGETDQTLRMLHALKGASANLSINGVFAITEQMESAINSGDMDRIEALRTSLKTVIAEVFDSIKSLQHEQPEPGNKPKKKIKDGSQVRAILDSLIAALHKYDPDESDLHLNRLAEYVDDEELMPVSTRLNEFDFDTALTETEKLRQSLECQ